MASVMAPQAEAQPAEAQASPVKVQASRSGAQVGRPAGAVMPMAAKYCVNNNHGAKACFQPYGDKVWVKDTRKDGYSAAAETKYSYSRGPDVCINKHGKGTWVVCNYNMREGRRVTLWSVDLNLPTNAYHYWSTGRTLVI